MTISLDRRAVVLTDTAIPIALTAMPRSHAVTNNGRNIRDFFKAAQVPQRPKSSQDHDLLEEIIVASASPRRQRAPTADKNSADEFADESLPANNLDLSEANDRDRHSNVFNAEQAADSLLSNGETRIPQDDVLVSRASRDTSPQRLPRKNTVTRDGCAKAMDLLSDSSSPPSSLSSSQFPISQASQSLGPQLSASASMPVTAVEMPPLTSEEPIERCPFPGTSLHSKPTANLSFSSAVSLSSVPASTQSSSRRIVKDGIKGVTNSDSDDSAESEEELPDVWSLLPAKRRKLSPPADCREDDSKHMSSHASRGAASRRPCSSNTMVDSSQPLRKNYQYNLMNMAIKAKNRRLAADRIATLEKATEHDQDTEDNSNLVELQNAIATAANDVDDQERIVLALDRTEALEQAQRFYFFSDDRPAQADVPFPRFAKTLLEKEPWRAILADEESRRYAFTTGTIADMAMHFPLDPHLTLWIAQRLMFENDEPLCESYVETLRRAAFNSGVPDDLAMIQKFCNVYPPKGRSSREMAPTAAPAGLEYIIRVVSLCSAAADETNNNSKMSLATFVHLALINVDDNVQKDFALPMTVARCIETMLDLLPAEVFADFTSKIADAFDSFPSLSRNLRCRVIISLPGGTQRSIETRRLLAIDLLTRASQSQSKYEPRTDLEVLILDALDQSHDFAIRDTTNYKLLQGLIAVLDLGIGAGHIPYHSPRPLNSATPTATLLKTKAPQQNDVTRHHDGYIDGLTRRLQSMSSQIRGAGTTHLARTEAKSSIERLIVRLEYSVRSKPRPRKSAFGVSGDGSLGSLLSFLKPASANALALKDKDGIDNKNAVANQV